MGIFGVEQLSCGWKKKADKMFAQADDKKSKIGFLVMQRNKFYGLLLILDEGLLQ